MAKWSNIKKKLECEYLCENLRGHIKYYVTSYSKSPDHNGRAAIIYKGKEIIKGSYYMDYIQEDIKSINIDIEKHLSENEKSNSFKIFDNQSFYNAFREFDNQNIKKSISSDNIIIKILAVLDKRTGKRTLKKLKENLKNEQRLFQIFYIIRAKSEGIM